MSALSSTGYSVESTNSGTATWPRMRLTISFISATSLRPTKAVETSIASIKLRVPHAGLAELHPADLATIIDQLAPKDRAGVLASLDDEAAAEAIEEMEPETQVEVLENLEPARAADILEEMAPDDAADVFEELGDEEAEEVLGAMQAEEASELRELLTYPPDTAGGIMTPDFAAVRPSLTVEQAIAEIRRVADEAETIHYVYVTDDENRLVGVLSLPDLVRARSRQPVTRSRPAALAS